MGRIGEAPVEDAIALLVGGRSQALLWWPAILFLEG